MWMHFEKEALKALYTHMSAHLAGLLLRSHVWRVLFTSLGHRVWLKQAPSYAMR